MAKNPASANFQFLIAHDAQLERLGALAERYFKDDPNTCLIKLRQFGELLAQLTAAKAGESCRAKSLIYFIICGSWATVRPMNMRATTRASAASFYGRTSLTNQL